MKQLLVVQKIGVLFVALSLAVSVCVFAKIASETDLARVLRLATTHGKMHLDLKEAFVSFENLALSHPKPFGEGRMAQIRSFSLDGNGAAFLTGKFQFETVRIELEELTVIRDETGRMNIDILRTVTLPGFRIDRLELKVDHVVFKDSFRKKKSVSRSVALDLNETYFHVTDLDALISTVAKKASNRAFLRAVDHLDPLGLVHVMHATLNSSIRIVEETSDITGGLLRFALLPLTATAKIII